MKTFPSGFSHSSLTLHFTSEYLRVVDHLKYIPVLYNDTYIENGKRSKGKRLGERKMS